MADEVGLGLSTLQFATVVLNRVLNLIAKVTSHFLSSLERWGSGFFGKLRLTAVLLPMVVVSALPAAFAANFGYAPEHWIDLLNPWARSISFYEPSYGLADQAARLLPAE